MSLSSPILTTNSTTRFFRACVFKPADGVFLFHPRAMERLISEHLTSLGLEVTIPRLNYYLMPCADFLTGLESENPEALAVIEGLSLPQYIILLPTPTVPKSDGPELKRLLREYWARRFEGEIARTWQIYRDSRPDDVSFNPLALSKLLGLTAFKEMRAIIKREGIIPAGVPEVWICRAFIALIVRLRYFSPGVRGFFFPALRDWRGFDRWLMEGGLLLPALRKGDPLPRLLAQTCPDPQCGNPALPPRVPHHLPYGFTDPDFDPAQAGSHQEKNFFVKQFIPTQDFPKLNWIPVATTDGIIDWLVAPEPKNHSVIRSFWNFIYDLMFRILLPIFIDILQFLQNIQFKFKLSARIYFLLFSRAVRISRHYAMNNRYARALIILAIARRYCATMGVGFAAEATQIRAFLTQRQQTLEQDFCEKLVATWRLGPDSNLLIRVLIQQLSNSLHEPARRNHAQELLRNLEQILLEGQTTYYRLPLFNWLFNKGYGRTPQVLPFQASLKALRLLEIALNQLEQFTYSLAEIEYLGRPLILLNARITKRLERALTPVLRRILQESGFLAHNHREEIAAHKLLCELLDVIQFRRHLKFTDVRDIVARNFLRLPDVTVQMCWRGDQLACFDRIARQSLPGIYQKGEFYIKGLQQLGAPLFGTQVGRWILRHLILPFGIAFLGCKTIDVILNLIPQHGRFIHFTHPWSIGITGLVLNAIAYTQVGRHSAFAVLRGLWWGVRMILFDGLKYLLHWVPLTRLFETSLVRGIDRNLLRPFLIGSCLVFPFNILNNLIEGDLVYPGVSLFMLALALGTLARNTPLGRHLLDETFSAVGIFLRRINQTLVVGLVRELMHFFKEVTRRFQQGLHRIEELLSHQVDESWGARAIKFTLVPLWRLGEALIQFYVTVLVEPQINPIKHFPLVSIAHKIMLPLLPVLTEFLVPLLSSIFPKWLVYPFVTLTLLLLPGLAGFLVWELKENWKIYISNHLDRNNLINSEVIIINDLSSTEPAIIGRHGETMRGILRRGFYSGALPKAFDRLRRVLLQQIRQEKEDFFRLREARRQLEELERDLGLFCERELAYPLRLRCQDPSCELGRVANQRPRLASTSCEFTLALYPKSVNQTAPLVLQIFICLLEPALQFTAALKGSRALLSENCWQLIREDVTFFSERVGATEVQLELI